MNIIFLDFDGVLNNQSSSFLNMISARHSGTSFQIAAPDATSVRLLDVLLDVSNAYIVVSSSWRQGKTVEELKLVLLNDFGLKNAWRVIDKTRANDIGEIRGDQIDAWITANKQKVDNYIVIDDDSDFHDHHQLNFVKTDRERGFTKNDFKLACSIFNIDYNRKKTDDSRI